MTNNDKNSSLSVESLTSILTTYTGIIEKYDRSNADFAIKCIAFLGVLVSACATIYGSFYNSNARMINIAF